MAGLRIVGLGVLFARLRVVGGGARGCPRRCGCCWSRGRVARPSAPDLPMFSPATLSTRPARPPSSGHWSRFAMRRMGCCGAARCTTDRRRARSRTRSTGCTYSGRASRPTYMTALRPRSHDAPAGRVSIRGRTRRPRWLTPQCEWLRGRGPDARGKLARRDAMGSQDEYVSLPAVTEGASEGGPPARRPRACRRARCTTRRAR
jgi:hypothetical protein